MHAHHEPSPEFLSHLEWQTRTELRRHQRFSGSAAPRTGMALRVIRAAALVLISLFSGAGLAFGVERIQESREQEVLLLRNRELLALAERRTEAALEVAEETRQRVAMGLTTSDSLLGAEERVAEHEREVEHLSLDGAELQASRRPLDRSLFAPLIAGRDFVGEGLRIDLAYDSSTAERLQVRLERTQAMYDSGLVNESELAAARHRLDLARGGIEHLASRIRLRDRFLAGELVPGDCERLDRRGEVEHRLRELDLQVEQLRAELDRARRLEAMGDASGVVRPLEARIDGLEVERRLVNLELDLLR